MLGIIFIENQYVLYVYQAYYQKQFFVSVFYITFGPGSLSNILLLIKTNIVLR